MSTRSLESRVGKLEKSVGKIKSEFQNRMARMEGEELIVFWVSVIWDVKGLFEDLKAQQRQQDEPSADDLVEIKKMLLSTRVLREAALEGWDRYASEEVKRTYSYVPKLIKERDDVESENNTQGG